MDRIRVLQMFNKYLNNTENWAYRLISNLPNTDVIIASREFCKCNFYSPKFEYLEFPMKIIEQNQVLVPVRMFNSLVSYLMKFYPRYVEKMVGKVDLMHSHFSIIGWEYRDLARKLEVPHIVSFYGFDYENLPHTHPEWREYYRILFKEADYFLCEGAHGVQTLEKMGCPAAKIDIVRLGVEIEKIPFYTRDKKSGALKLLQLATFVEKKGHIYTVLAFTEALWECPNMSLTLVGGDPIGIKKELQRMIQGTRAEGKVTFVDRIDFGQLYEFMKEYQVFIHPSCYSKEMDCEGGAPVVLLDAQATGMPVISTTHCDIPNEVVHGETGLLCPEKDVSELSAAIVKFYTMGPAEYNKFAMKARNHVASNYDSRLSSQRLEKIYRELAAK